MIINTIPTSDCTPQTIVIGRRATYDTLQVVFDLSYLAETYGSGAAVLVVKRSQDETAYPATITQDGNTLTWTISETDTYYVGAGECELMWYVNNGLAKTIIYPVVVMRDILQTAEEPPDAYENWVESLTALGAETLQNAQDAAQSASDAESAKNAAEDAADRAEEAVEAFTHPTASAETLAPDAPATAAYNDGHFTFGIPKGDKGDQGSEGPRGESAVIYTLEPSVSAVKYNPNATAGNKFSPKNVTVRLYKISGSTKSRWTADSIITVIDQYSTEDYNVGFVTITLDDRYLDQYSNIEVSAKINNEIVAAINLTIVSDGENGATGPVGPSGVIQSVNGKSAASITLDAGDLEFDDSDTYAAGSVGAELYDQKNAIDSLIEDVVLVQTTQPVEDVNRIWVDPSDDEIEIPTMDDLDILSNALKEYNTYPLSSGFSKTSGTHNGITYTWHDDGTCTVSGTATSASVNNLYNNPTGFPYGIEPGKTYNIRYVTTDANVWFSLRCYKTGSNDEYINIISSSLCTIPADSIGIQFRLYVGSGVTFETPATISAIGVVDVNSTFSKIEALESDAKRLSGEQLEPYSVYNKTVINPSFSQSAINAQGLIVPTYNNYASTNYIPIPENSVLHIEQTGMVRVATYDINKACLNIQSQITDTVVEVSSDSAKYAALMFYNILPQNINNILHECSIIYKAADISADYLHASGTVVSIDNASKMPFKSVALSGNGANTKITVSNKNLFWQNYTNLSLTTNGVTFGFDHINQTIRVVSNGATGNAFSASSELGEEFHYVNNVGWWHNFKFCFGEDTIVTFAGNMSQEMAYDSKIRFDVYDGSMQLNDDGNGVTFEAKAGREYGVRIVVLSGWSGDVTFKPQLEIGSHATAFEGHSGGTFGTSVGEDNIFALTNKTKYKSVTNGITMVFDCVNQTISLTANPSSAVTITNYSNISTVNGVAWNHLFKWTGDGGTVWVGGLPDKVRGKVRAQISDGTTTWFDYGDGVSFTTVSGTEYAYRLYILANQYLDDTIQPIIATGINAVKMCGGKGGLTHVYANDNTVVALEAYLLTDAEKIDKADSAAARFNVLTSRKTPYTTRLGKRKPMVSFIDDDTSSVALVTRYHDVMSSKGVLGGFAVETINLDNNTGLPELLLDYEEEGYACLYHCYIQRGDETRYWEENNAAYDESLIKENFMRGLRSIREYGFSNYKHWVTPYGVNSDFIQDLAKNHGMESMMTMGMNISNTAFMSIYGNVDRYNIPRVTLNKNVDDLKMHTLLEGCVADRGWVILMTHANTWTSTSFSKQNWDGTTTTYANEDAYIAHVVQQCLDLGMDVVPYTVAYEQYKPVFYFNELF